MTGTDFEEKSQEEASSTPGAPISSSPETTCPTKMSGSAVMPQQLKMEPSSLGNKWIVKPEKESPMCPGKLSHGVSTPKVPAFEPELPEGTSTERSSSRAHHDEDTQLMETPVSKKRVDTLPETVPSSDTNSKKPMEGGPQMTASTDTESQNPWKVSRR